MSEAVASTTPLAPSSSPTPTARVSTPAPKSAPTTTDLVSIYSNEAEVAVIGCALLDNDVIADEALDTIPKEAFTPANSVVWDAILRLYRRNIRIDLVTLTEALRQGGKLDWAGGVPALVSLADFPGTVAFAGDYAHQLRQAYRRRLIAVASVKAATKAKAGTDSPDKVLSDLEMDLYRIARAEKGTPLEDAADMAAMYATGGARMATGFTGLDRVCVGGLPIGDLTVVAGRTSMGKSALVHQIAFAVGNAHILSPDQPLPEILANEACRRTGLPLEMVQTGAWRKDEDRQRWLDELDAVKADVRTRVTIDDGSLTLERMVTEVRRAALRGRKLVVVDHIQRVKPDAHSSSRREHMIDVTASLKDLARDFGITVIALSQLSRELDKLENKRPNLGHLSESKSIEEDSNMVLFIYREKYYDPATPSGDLAEIIVAKNKGGPRNRVHRLAFRERLVKFEEVFP